MFSFRGTEADKISQGLSIGNCLFDAVRICLELPWRLSSRDAMAKRLRRRMGRLSSGAMRETRTGNSSAKPSLQTENKDAELYCSHRLVLKTFGEDQDDNSGSLRSSIMLLSSPQKKSGGAGLPRRLVQSLLTESVRR